MSIRRRISKRHHGGGGGGTSHRRLSTSYATSHRRLLGIDSSHRKLITPSISHRFSIHDSYRTLPQPPAALEDYDEQYGIDDIETSEYDNLYTIESCDGEESYQSIEEGEGEVDGNDNKPSTKQSTIATTITSLPSIILLAILSLMMSVPFGSAYFLDFVPLSAVDRQALGMRLCLLSGAISREYNVYIGCVNVLIFVVVFLQISQCLWRFVCIHIHLLLHTYCNHISCTPSHFSYLITLKRYSMAAWD